MRIDSHQHFWKYDPREYTWIDDTMASLRRDFLPDDAKREMDLCGFDASVAVQARQTLEETRRLLELADRHSFIVGVVGWVDLRSPDAATQLARFAQHPKLVGIRHIVQDEADDRFLLRPEFRRGIALLEEFHLAYDVLVYPRHLPLVEEFVALHGRQRFVLDHLGKPPIRRGETSTWERDLRKVAAQPNVYAKLSGLVTESDWQGWTAEQLRPCLDAAFDCFGPDRLMIGSDWPVCTVAASYGRAMAVVERYMEGRPAEEREAVLGGNARRFWRLGDGVATAMKERQP